MTTTCTACVAYTNNSVIIPASAYTNCAPQSPAQLTLRVTRAQGSPTAGDTSYTVVLGDQALTSFLYAIKADGTIISLGGGVGVPPFYINGQSGFQTITCGTTTLAVPNATTFNITFTTSDTNTKPNDSYTINVSACCNGSINNVSVTFTRVKASTFSARGGPGGVEQGVTSCIDCPCLIQGNCGNVRVPIVSILGQTTVDGSDIGDVIFTICDEFTYYKEEKICHDNRCAVIFVKPNEIKQTLFRKCCPSMVSVLKGKGMTLNEKARSIYALMSESIGTSFEVFYNNILLYGMAKYILSRILYGRFNIDFLLGKYNERFLRDLGMSRFCSFVQFFSDCESEVYGFNKYFKSGKHGAISSSSNH